MLSNCGVYCVRNILNGRRYIGSSFVLNQRKCRHFYTLKKGKNHSKLLQEDYNKYGKGCFIFEVLEYCEKENLIEREQYWMDYYNSWVREYGYNSSKTAGFTTHSKETKKRMSVSARNKKPISEETRQKHRERMMGNAYRLGKKHTPEVVEKHRKRMMGNNYSHIGKLRKLNMFSKED